jgi:acyl-CoA synthetase (AMP-forming)/AMP-acid ligase II
MVPGSPVSDPFASDALFGVVARQARATPEAPALLDVDGPVSYGQLHAGARALAGGLAAQGVGRGDVVAVQLPNGLPFVLTLLAAQAVGAAVQTVHMPYRRAELAALLGHSGARAFVGLSAFRDAAPAATVVALRDAADGGLPRLATVIAVGEPVPGALPWPRVCAAAPLRETAAAGADAPSVLLYTSGTTASPKGVPGIARRYLGNAADAVRAWHLGPDDVLLAVAPFSHLYGLFVLECGLLAGASLSVLPAFTPDGLLAVLRRDRPTAVFAGPAHLKPLLDGGTIDAGDFAATRLLCLSGTTVPPALARAVEAHLPAGRVIQLWGMSELQAGAYGRLDDPPSIRHETAGRAAPRTELRVVDDTGADAPTGAEGRLWVRGASVFDGYLDNPAASAEAFRAGWFDTGDTALLRTDGALVLTGRVKELIDRGGVKFNPVDVETLLDTVPGVGRCVLAPMPDPVLGERACAFVVRDGSAEVTLASLTAALQAAGVAKLKWPERLEFVDELPVTPTQKVRRALLTELVTRRMQA